MAILRKASGFQECGGDPMLLCNMDSESHDYETMVFMVDGDLWNVTLLLYGFLFPNSYLLADYELSRTQS